MQLKRRARQSSRCEKWDMFPVFPTSARADQLSLAERRIPWQEEN